MKRKLLCVLLFCLLLTLSACQGPAMAERRPHAAVSAITDMT